MLNFIWLAFVVLAVLIGGFTGRLPEVTKGAFETAKDAVMVIALPLVGIMAIWLGIMKLAEQSGLVQVIARALRPLLRRLFPDVPHDHPAMGSMVMNIAANMLGLGNAATPLGLRAMRDLESLNPRPGTATNAMCTFLAVNTSSVQLIPTTAIGILAISGALNPTAIVSTAFMATLCAAVVGVASAKFLEKLPAFRLPAVVDSPMPAAEKSAQTTDAIAVEKITAAPLTPWKRGIIEGFILTFLALGVMLVVWPFPDFSSQKVALRILNIIALLAVPFLLSFFPLYAALRGVKVYEQFVEGAKEAFGVAQRIIPFLVAMLVAIKMFRDAGGIDMLAFVLAKPLAWLGFPVELLPMTLMRPLSGGATLGLFTDVVRQFGGDHFNSRLAATIYGSTETTFYVLAVYFGSVAVRRTRHAVYAGLLADLTGVIVSVLVCRLMFM